MHYSPLAIGVLLWCIVLPAVGCDETMAPPPTPTLERGPGHGQFGYAGARLYQPLQVRVIDRTLNQGMPGVTVNWTVIEGGGTLSASSGVTNGVGLTEVEWTLGPEPGFNRVVAAIDTTASIEFFANAVAVPDCTHGCWTYGRPLPTSRASLAAAVEGGTIYTVGGDPPRTFCRGESIVDKYDVATDTWAFGPRMPTPRSNLAVAVVHGKLHAIGGCGLDRVLGVNEEYDPATDRWRTLAPLQSPRLGLAAATLGDRIFTAGGGLLRSDATVPDVESFDPETNAWRYHAALPTPRAGLALVAAGGKLYAIGGYWSDFELATVEMYDPALDRWFPRASMKRGAGAITAVVLDDRIHAMASWRDDSAVEVYDPLTDTWVRITDIGMPRIHAAAASIAGCVYLIGGVESISGYPVNSLEIYSPANGCRRR